MLSQRLANLDVQSLYSEKECKATENVWTSDQYIHSKANAHQAARKAGLDNIETARTYKCEQDGDKFELEMKIYTPEMKKFCKGEGDCEGVMDINDIRDHCLIEGFGCEHREDLALAGGSPRDMLHEDDSDPRKWTEKYWGKIVKKDEKLMKEAKEAAKKAWKKKVEHDKKLMEQAKKEAEKKWEEQQIQNKKMKKLAKEKAKKTWKKWQKEQKELGEQAKKEAKKEWAKQQKKKEAKKDKKDE